jgi:hypothetical protein
MIALLMLVAILVLSCSMGYEVETVMDVETERAWRLTWCGHRDPIFVFRRDGRGRLEALVGVGHRAGGPQGGH